MARCLGVECGPRQWPGWCPVSWALLAANFIRKHWQSIGVVLVLGSLVVGVASLWGRLEVEQGRNVKLAAELEAATVELETSATKLATCIKANREWQESYDQYLEGQAQLNRRLATYRDRLEAELALRREAAATIDGLNLQLASQVTAEECLAAVGQPHCCAGLG